MKFKTFLSLVIIGLTSAVLASEDKTIKDAQGNICPDDAYFKAQLEPKKADEPVEESPWLFCPDVSQLYKKDNYWFGPPRLAKL